MSTFDEAVVAPRRTYVALPGLEVIERPGWVQLRHPAFRSGGYNEVAHCGLEDVDVDAVIAGYRARGIAFRWYVAPDTKPADLGERLAARGFRIVESLALARDTSPIDADGDVERVTEATVDEFTDTMAAAWGLDGTPMRQANRLTLASSDHRFYLARIAGQAVASSGLVLYPRSAYLIAGVVMPAARKRGVYRAMVARRITEAREAGRTMVTARAIATTSAPLLLKLGFEVVAPMASYHDRVSDDFAALRTRFEEAYRRLEHEARDDFDLACAERALAIADDAIGKRLLRLRREGAPPVEIEAVREAVEAVIARRRSAEDHPTQIAVAVARAVVGATLPVMTGLANSDYSPTSADETRTAAYLAEYVRTQDLDAAEAVRDAELRWQLARIHA